MKKVLLIGDSIRMGYGPFVRERLRDVAEVFYPDENCRFTQYTLVCLDGWVKLAGDPARLDLVHWNNGHWDAAHWQGEACSLNTVEQYAGMLERIYRRLIGHCPAARIIFALTTPMNPALPATANPRTNDEIDRYNAAVAKLMQRLGVPVNDLCTPMRDRAAWYTDHCHFSEEGYRFLSALVAEEIRRRL
jgi:lysophospholipase L1-like esterase